MSLLKKNKGKEVGNNSAPAKKGVEMFGITWFPEKIKEMKEEEFIKSHIDLPAFVPRGKVDAATKASHKKKAEEKLKEVYSKLKK